VIGLATLHRPSAVRVPRPDGDGHQHGARCYGRRPCGERLVAAVPQGHWQTTTFIVGLKQSGIVALLVRDGPITRSGVASTPRSPWRRRSSPGDLVLLDDLAAHKVAGVRQAIAAAGATILYRRPTRLTSTRSSSCRQAQGALA
jgi:hypothetical protein